jgi:hypothetical protein
MYILNNTRKNSSARSSQRGIRCGACPEPFAAG